MVDKAFCNVLLLSFGFFFTCTAYVSVFNAQKYVIESIKKDYPSYDGDAYIALCITFACLSVFIWLAPPIIRLIGPRSTLVVGAVFNVVYIAQFLYPVGWVLYFSSVISGIVGALVWNAQGYFLTVNSTEATMARNSGILWAIIQSGNIIGNIYIFVTIKKDIVNKNDRYILFGFMTAMVSIAVVFMSSLQKAVYPDKEKLSPMQTFLNIAKLLLSIDMLFLSITFLFVGIETSFFIGVYSNALAFMQIFDIDATTIISVSGVLIGVGEVTGGILFGLLSCRYISKWRHYLVILIGLMVCLVAYIIVILTIPDCAVNGPTFEKGYMKTNIYVALLCSLLMGFADSCYVTQIYAFLGKKYKHESSEAFALFKFMQTGATAVAFLYTPIGIYNIICILFVFAGVGTVTFIFVEVKFNIKSLTLEENEEPDGFCIQVRPVKSNYM